MSVSRTPTKASSCNDLQNVTTPTQSQLNFNENPLSGTQFVNQLPRSKRHCPDSSPEEQTLAREQNKFQQEMKDMFADFMDKQTTMIFALVKDVNAIKIQNEQIFKSNSEIEKSVEVIRGTLHDITGRIESLEKDRKQVHDCFLQLEKKTQVLEDTNRPSSVEIRNIPNKEHETYKDLINYITQLAASLSITIQPSHIRDARRLPTKPGSNRILCVEFTSVHLKTSILQAAREFNISKKNVSDKLNLSHIGFGDNNDPIYISEYLPASDRKLFHDARDFAKKYEYNYCWTSHGRILIKKNENSKAIRVYSHQSLTDLSRDL